jgi:DNA-directed RNA polymerase subunit M/transcription elongation factor TFIIS
MQEEVMSCPLCGDPMTLKSSRGNSTVSCSKCAFEIDLARLGVLVDIKRKQEEMGKMQDDYEEKVEQLGRLLTMLSIGSMDLKKPTETAACGKPK